MRLHWLELRHYRGVVERKVEFSTTGITIVRGPNESGKSSLVEALRLLLDFPHNSGRAEIRAIQPVQGDFGPEVAALLELGGVVFEYRKRWVRDAVTELRVLEPVPQQLSGREAHDFVSHQLYENLDRALFDALRYVQGETVSQHALVNSTSLMTSLDAATSTVVRELDAGSTLQEAVRKEYERYYTATGKPRDDRRRLGEAVNKAKDDLDRARSDLEGLEAAGDSLRRKLGEIVEREQQIKDVAARLGELASEELRCVEQERLRDDASGDLDRAAVQVETKERLLFERHALIEQQDQARSELGKLSEDLRDLQEELADLGERVRIETDARGEAQRKLDEARLEAQVAHDVLEGCRQVEELTRVERQFQLAQEAEADLNAACAVISEHAGIGPSVLEDIQVALDRVTECEAKVRAGETTLAVRALRESVLEVDGVRETLRLAETRNPIARAGTRFVVDDAVEIVVQGPSLVSLDSGLTQARAALNELVIEHRLDPRDPRRDLEERLRVKADAEFKRSAGERRLQDVLDGTPAGDLALRLEELRVTAAQGPPPLPLDEAVKKSEHARNFLRDREARLQELDEVANALKRTWDEKRVQSANLEGRHHQVENDLDRASAVLGDARGKCDDATLEQEVSQAKTSQAEAHKRWELARDAYEALDPGRVAVFKESTREELTQLEREQREAGSRRDELKGSLLALGQGDLQSSVDRANVEFEDCRRRFEALERQARAAKLLYETFAHHRDIARQSRVAPFTKEVNRLAKFVFGCDVLIEVDPGDLSIMSRTLNGATVKYPELSTGAREQLSVVAMLACASLVETGTTDAGVPVILDDALGFSDSDRLARLGPVFQEVARKSQIILLTASTTRYSSVGIAKVVNVQ